jgi:hypothetical protein
MLLCKCIFRDTNDKEILEIYQRDQDDLELIQMFLMNMIV